MTRQRLTGVLFAVVTTLPAFAADAQTASDIVVRDAWVREATSSDRATGAFLVVENHSAIPVSIVGAEGAGAGTAELHTMKMVERPASGANPRSEMMSMERVTEIPIPARGSVELKPGSFHIMLFSLSKPLDAGGTASLTLRFSNGLTKTVPVAVLKRSATAIK